MGLDRSRHVYICADDRIDRHDVVHEAGISLARSRMPTLLRDAISHF